MGSIIPSIRHHHRCNVGANKVHQGRYIEAVEQIAFARGLVTHLDWHVGDGEEVVERNAECFVQLFLVFSLQRRLSTQESGAKIRLVIQ